MSEKIGSSAKDLWRAPFRGNNPITASITIPGSKSATNRALILAALAKTPSTLRKPLHSRDSALMIAGLKAIGCDIAQESNRDLKVTPAKFFGPASVDVGNAGTVMRFLPPVAALANGLIHFDGDARSHERPVGPVISALEELGVTIEHGNRYSLPLTINGSGQIKGGDLEIDASASSQFISALLLIGPATQIGITIKDIGVSLPSLPHIEMTIEMLKKFGARVESKITADGRREWRVEPGELIGQDLIIEPDLSNAAPFMAAAMISGGEVVIADWPKSTAQPGDQLRKIFTEMGARIEFVGSGLKISGTGKILGIDIDLHDVGELTPAIAALSSLAKSPSTLRGIGHLRLHETDRLSALANEINNLGGAVTEGPGELLINPRKMLASQIFKSYEDHRMATAGAIIGLAVDGVTVENIETTRKTLPDFPGMWQMMLKGA